MSAIVCVLIVLRNTSAFSQIDMCIGISFDSHYSNPSLRVAYIDEVGEGNHKEYYSKLVKVIVDKDNDKNATEQVHLNFYSF